MKRMIFFVLSVLAAFVASCSTAEKSTDQPVVLIKTEYGDIKVKLYEKTPEHRKNFLKLIHDDFYDGLLFHRVIQNFMIQGGDPESKNAEPGEKLGGGSLDYTVPAEFFPEYYHKRGALAAARRGGLTNQEKRSSASQFYIVQGEVFSEAELDTLEIIKNQGIKNELVREGLIAFNTEIQRYKRNNDRDSFAIKVAEISDKADSIIDAKNMHFKFTEEQREIYTTIGGYPSLDGDYTVFGEVVEGMEVVDKIAAMETDKNNRPLKNIKMKIELIK